jgi:hypothetical protein
MSPHPNNFDGTGILENLVNKSIVDVDSSRIRVFKVTDELFVGRRVFVGINAKNL